MSSPENYKLFPFDSKKKRMSTFVKNESFPTGYRLYTKGGSENAMVYSSRYIDKETGQVNPITDEIKEYVNHQINEMNKKNDFIYEKELEEFKKQDANGKVGVFDSESWFALQTYNGGDKIGNLNLIETFANNAFKTLELLKSMGFKILDSISQGAGALWERTHTSVMPMGTGIISTLLNEVKKHDNIKVLTYVEAKEILTNVVETFINIIHIILSIQIIFYIRIFKFIFF